MKALYTKSLIILTIFCLLGYSCNSIKNANNTQKGAVIGGVVGGALGAILVKDNPVLAGVIGAAVGGAAGGIIGNKMDKQATDIEEALPGAKVERVGEIIRVVLHQNAINFEFDKSNLTDSTKINLTKLIAVFNQYPDTNLLIQGFTDSKGSDEYNLKLSDRRAQSVYNYLIKNGMDSGRLTTQGLGEINPIADNETEEGRAKNRRVEFTISANDKMKEEAKKEAEEQTNTENNTTTNN